jgi:acyl-coenzyme A synthetase/AMP-(fatty) acid ligase
MPANAHPRRVFFRKSLPLTGTRKVDRSHLEAEAASAVDGSL